MIVYGEPDGATVPEASTDGSVRLLDVMSRRRGREELLRLGGSAGSVQGHWLEFCIPSLIKSGPPWWLTW